MVRRLRWSDNAGRQFEAWTDYLAGYDADFAKRSKEAVETRVNGLVHHPYRWRGSRWPGLREFSLLKWKKVVVYQVQDREIVIIAFYDTRQDLSGMSPKPE